MNKDAASENISNNSIVENYDVVVVGAGHAGCEAALATARLGFNTIIFTVSIDNIAMMPCNPNIGGSSKGHLVCELDALGGEMGKNIDKTFIQSKMLNKSKGPAVHSLRAQADKKNYSASMRNVLENTDNLTLRQSEVAELICEGSGDNKKVIGIKTVSGARYYAKAVILATGVYLNARCIYGDVEEWTGPNGLRAATHLTKSLEKEGLEILRFKTGTPARVDKRSLDFSKMEEQKGDVPIVPFSFSTNKDEIQKEQISCWLTHTTTKTHDIIKANIDRSPLFSGKISGTGPRYCPSIEDKVVKYPEKDKHQIFVEPEGLYTNEMYLSGMSSSLPEDVQFAMYKTLPGLENVKIVRPAYAIEYDLTNSLELKPSLEYKKISNLFAAGQINGSSGYEEAAAQGLIAGINAALSLQNKEPVILDRSSSYIGVLVDDLVTKQLTEPYRMMTSRAEYRLLLRQDNADLRLRDIGYKVGLVDEETYKKFCIKRDLINKEIERTKETFVGGSEKVNSFLEKNNSAPLSSGITIAELCKRPELSYEMLSKIDETRPTLPEEVVEQVSIELKYEGYIKRQNQQIENFKKMESKKIPQNINYSELKNLRLEARQKLDKIRPENVGQASRIMGVSPADIAVLLVHLKK